VTGKESIYVNNIFEQPWWLDIVAKDKWQEFTTEINGEIVARLPIVIIKKWFGKIAIMPVQTQTLGLWIKNIEFKENETNKDLSYQKEIINKILDQIPRGIYFKIALDSSNKYVLPYVWRGFNIKPTFSYRIIDLSDIEKIFKGFDNTVKKNIKSASKKVKIIYDTDTDKLINMLDITFKNQGREYPISKAIIREIIKECDNRNSGIMISAIDDEENVHACSYFVYDKKTFYYLISGSDPRFRTSGAQTLILWEAIKHASTVSKMFDFEGSNIESIEKFFRQFGGSQIVNYEIRKLPLILEIYEIIKPQIKRILKYKQ